MKTLPFLALLLLVASRSVSPQSFPYLDPGLVVPVNPIPTLIGQPEDSLMATTTVGAMRKALQYQEAYADLFNLVNGTFVPKTKAIVTEYNRAVDRIHWDTVEKFLWFAGGIVIGAVGSNLLK